MVLAKSGDQRRDMAAAKTRRCGGTQMPTGLDIGQVSEQALAVFQKRTAYMRERGAHQQLDPQPFLQAIQQPAHDGGCHTFGLGSRSQTAARHD